MSHAESLRFPLPELPQLDPEDVKAVRSFLPGKLLGRTAAVLPTASRPRLRRRDSCVAEKGRDRPSQRLRKCELLVPGLFADLDFGLLQRRVCTTGPAFGSAEPNRRQILVGVVARADLPVVDVGAQRH